MIISKSKMEEDDAKAFITALSFEKSIPIDFTEKDTDKGHRDRHSQRVSQR